MTVIRPNSVSGINSITAQANEIKIFKSDGTQGGLMIDGANLNATSGISTVAALTVTGNVSVGGTLTYQDVTNIDSVGVITARSGINVTGGNVDIGGATHSRNLSVHDATNGVILIEGASNGTSNLMFADENDEDVGMLGYNHASNYLTFTVNAAERLRITSAGRLLLGTTDAGGNNTANHLVVSNNAGANDQAGITIRGGTSGRSQIFFSDGNSGQDEYRGMLRYDHSENSMQFRTNATERVRIDSSGNMQVSTGQFTVGTTASTGLQLINDGTFGTIQSADLKIRTAATERLRIRSGGPHLLIGTGGDATYNEITESSSNAGLVIGSSSMGNGGIVIRNSTSGTGRIYFADNSGSDPGRQRGQINYYHNGDYMMFATAGSERVRITSSGQFNVGSGSFVVESDGDISTNVRCHGHIELDSTGSFSAPKVKMYANTGVVELRHDNGGGIGPYLSLQNRSTTAGTATGISFGCDNSDAVLDGVDYGNAQIKVFSDSGGHGNMEINLHTGANRGVMKMVGNGQGYSGASAGTEGMRGGVAFGNAGIAIDRSWMGQPGIHVFNANVENDTDQGTFRFHGWNKSYASYPGSSGSDFGVNLVGDGTGLSSDERRKTGITTITDALNTVSQMRGVSFQLINSELTPQTHMTMDNGTKLGFVAQEVIPILPQIVIDAGGEKAVPHENGYCDRYAIDYGSVTALLVEAIKDLKADKEALEARIAALEGS